MSPSMRPDYRMEQKAARSKSVACLKNPLTFDSVLNLNQICNFRLYTLTTFFFCCKN